MKALVVLSVIGAFIIGCTYKSPVPPQDSYSITVIYKKCGDTDTCRVVAENEDDTKVRPSSNYGDAKKRTIR